MKTLFRWTLNHNLVGFAIFILLQIIIFSIGFPLILYSYEQNQIRERLDQATAILIDSQSPEQLVIDNSRSFFVFSADMELVYSNRGQGRSISEESLFPIKYNNTVIGYYYGENFRFTSTKSNAAFLWSSIGLLVFSLGFSTLVGILMAIRFSRGIVGPVEEIKIDIDGLKGKQLIRSRQFKVAELTEISSSLVDIHRQLLTQEEYKQQWMQDISHDLRTPISGLKGQLEGIRDEVFTADPPRMERLLSEISRLEGLVASVGNLLQLENLPDLKKQSFSLSECLNNLIRSYETEIRKKNIIVTGPGTSGNVFGQRDLLERAFDNILNNSMKFTPADGSITINIKKDPAHLVVRITNSGPPIPPEHADKIFHRLYRGDLGRTSPGSGLGLNIAREIMRMHGGDILLSENDASGVAFDFIFSSNGEQRLREA